MTDTISPLRRSANMARIKSKDTKPELRVRQAAHAMGYRFRVHYDAVAGKPDLAFTARKKAIFVHGCFWHQHSAKECLDGRRPKSNSDYWDKKLDRNLARDRANENALHEVGWDVLTIWDCRTQDPAELCRELADFLGPPRCAP